MATKSESAEIAVLQTQMDDVQKSIATLDTNQTTNFKILSDKLDGIPYSITAIDARITVLEKKNSKSWVNNTLSALLGIIVTGLVSLIIFLLTNQK